jgi:hypothetical protein
MVELFCEMPLMVVAFAWPIAMVRIIRCADKIRITIFIIAPFFMIPLDTSVVLPAQ